MSNRTGIYAIAFRKYINDRKVEWTITIKTKKNIWSADRQPIIIRNENDWKNSLLKASNLNGKIRG